MPLNEGSHYGAIPIPSSALRAITLRHLFSELDPSIAVVDGVQEAGMVTGLTEWIGRWRNSDLTVGWDWGVVRGVVVLLNPAEIRSNIQLLAPDGTLEPVAIGQAHLMDWLETVPWREVIGELLADRASPSPP